MRASRVRPFPWQFLAPVSRADAAVCAMFRRWGAAHVSLAGFSERMRDIVGDEIEILVRGAESGNGRAGLAAPDGLGVVLAAGSSSTGILVDIEAPFASALATRILKRPARIPLTAVDARSPSLAGALAAVLIACARRGYRGTPLRVAHAGPSADLIASLGPAEDLCCLSLTVLLGHDAFAVRLFLARALAQVAPPAPWDRGVLSSLGSLRLSMPVVAHALTLSAADLASVVAGDALLLTEPALRREGAHFVGAVHLADAASTTGVRAELVDPGSLVLRGEVESLLGIDKVEDCTMDAEQGDALVESVGEVPIVVRVEVGEATMTAREWAGLGKGDVIALSRRIGEHVVLRVGGVPIATGELVEVDGELGVRILARTSQETTKA